MTPDEFRRIALALPEAEERAHMAHPDFRVRGKIFATLGYPDEGWGMVKLNPEQQYDLTRAAPDMFVPVKGSWGRRGGTCVRLEAADDAAVRRAMAAAWRNTAPKALAKQA
jgi:hypothetical protein